MLWWLLALPLLPFLVVAVLGLIAGGFALALMARDGGHGRAGWMPALRDPKVPTGPRPPIRVPWTVRLLPWRWFDNYDDPASPDHGWLAWRLRNLLHNGNFFVWGFADRAARCWGRHPGAIWSPQVPGWNWFWSRPDGVPLWLPYVSFIGGPTVPVKFYLGWCGDNGFGLELIRSRDID